MSFMNDLNNRRQDDPDYFTFVTPQEIEDISDPSYLLKLYLHFSCPFVKSVSVPEAKYRRMMMREIWKRMAAVC